jgi:hypothetical protein
MVLNGVVLVIIMEIVNFGADVFIVSLKIINNKYNELFIISKRK